MTRKWTSEAERQAFFLTRKVDRAIREHDMIQEGDRILVGVSGGKDSMSLLGLLIHWLKYSPVKYELVVGHVIGDARGPVTDVPESFTQWLENEGVPYELRESHLADNEQLPMKCERCGRNRRRTLFEMADTHNCNKVALAHHLEDFAHTALINLFASGKLETMAFRRDYFGGKFSIIRPLAYIKESAIIRFAKTCEFPIVPSNCPIAPTSSRESARKLMFDISRGFRQASVNVVKAASGNTADI